MAGEDGIASSSTTNHPTSSMPSGKTLKPGSFACTLCHQKKRKCDGKRPACSLCVKRQVTCCYSATKPSVAVEDRLARLEDLVTKLLERDDVRGEGFPAPTTHSNDQRRDNELSLGGIDDNGAREPLWDSELLASVPRLSIPSVDDHVPFRRLSGSSTADTVRRHPPFHNPSSLYSLPSPPASASTSHQQTTHSESRDARTVRSRLAENARNQRDEEEAVLFIYTLNLPEAPMELYAYLLDSYWTWIHPMFNMVYRPAFCRGMSETTSRYFNSFLFYALMSFSTHFCKDHAAMIGHEHLIELFHAKSRVLLVEELDKPSSIPTSQGLLLLSAIEHTKGSVSQGWNFAGMAFRMVQDLGIHLDSTQPVSRSTDDAYVDLEVRKRLWWSAYLWDKMISVYVGRTPMLQHTLLVSPQVIMDDSTENDPWIPIGLASPNMVQRAGYEVSTFIMACRAAVVMNRALLRFYCDGAKPIAGQVSQEDVALMSDAVSLRDTIPVRLRIEHDQTVPTHLSHLCCLIHAVIILTHRPFIRGSRHGTDIGDQCRLSAQTILKVIETEREAYGSPRFTIAAWTLWTATGVFLVQLRDSTNAVEAEALRDQIQACRSLLLGMATYHPSLHRSVEILDKELSDLGVALNSGESREDAVSQMEDDSGLPTLHLFAFPQVFETSFEPALR